jgi:hypothetical protein
MCARKKDTFGARMKSYDPFRAGTYGLLFVELVRAGVGIVAAAGLVVFVGPTTAGDAVLGCAALPGSKFGGVEDPCSIPVIFSPGVRISGVTSGALISGLRLWVSIAASLSLTSSLTAGFFSGPFFSGFKKRSGTPLAAYVPLPTQAPRI